MAYQQELYRIAKDYVKPQAIKKKIAMLNGSMVTTRNTILL
jgi:hypothetical protein